MCTSARKRVQDSNALMRASHLRKLGEMYLQSGNLVQARVYLQSSQDLLRMSNSTYRQHQSAIKERQ